MCDPDYSELSKQGDPEKNCKCCLYNANVV